MTIVVNQEAATPTSLESTSTRAVPSAETSGEIAEHIQTPGVYASEEPPLPFMFDVASETSATVARRSRRKSSYDAASGRETWKNTLAQLELGGRADDESDSVLDNILNLLNPIRPMDKGKNLGEWTAYLLGVRTRC